MAKTVTEIEKYKEELANQQSSWQCLSYASKLYQFVSGTSGAGCDNPREYWKNSSYAQNMHVVVPSVVIWFNDSVGHAGFLEGYNKEGKLVFTDANGGRSGKIQTILFDNETKMAEKYKNFKGYVTR